MAFAVHVVHGSLEEASPGANDNSYGILPQAYGTHVGEHMLALLQALEPFASDREDLQLANLVMANVKRVAQQPWLDLISDSGCDSATEELVYRLMEGKYLIDLVIGAVALDEEDEDDDEEDNDKHAKESTAFCNAWLDAVGLAVTGRLLEQCLRIPSLTLKGSQHLHADLGYLVNVVSALGISGHAQPLLGHISELPVMDARTFRECISNLDRTYQLTDFMWSLEERVSAMRGN
jgi:conserved oligomeric Golgi complex subunit 7